MYLANCGVEQFIVVIFATVACDTGGVWKKILTKKRPWD